MRTSAAYDRLANMGQRLLEVIRHNRGGANRILQNLPARSLRCCATNGIDNIDKKQKGIWQTLPVPLRGAATLLAVLALAALLTTVRHNASAYLTGVWDTGLPDARLWPHPPDGAGAARPGGFLGVHPTIGATTRTAHCSGTTPPPTRRRSTLHPSVRACRGWLFGRVNRLLRHWLPDGLARETALYWLNSTLFYAAELLVALAVWEEFGPLAAAFGFASVLLAPRCSAA